MTLKLNLRKGLVGHWTMNNEDTSGGTLYDRTSYNNHGTLFNTPSTGESGKIKESFNFEFDNTEYIDTGAKVLSDNEPFTVSCWCNIESHTGTWERTVASHSPNAGFWLGLHQNGSNWQAGMRDSSGDGIIVTGDSFNTGQWYHTLIRWDGSSFELFVDNSSIGTDTSSTFTSTTDSINIARSEHYGEHWDGKIDDVRIYKRSLSRDEISILYNMRSERHASI